MKKVRSITFDKDYNATVEEVTFKDKQITPTSKLSPIFYSPAPIALTIVIFGLVIFVGISVGIMAIPTITAGQLANTTAPVQFDTGFSLLTVCLIVVAIGLLMGGIWYGSIPKEMVK